jgi:hypothetical protein
MPIGCEVVFIAQDDRQFSVSQIYANFEPKIVDKEMEY